MAKLVFDLPIPNDSFRRTRNSEMFCLEDLNKIWNLNDDKAYCLTVYDEKPEDFDREVRLTDGQYYINDTLNGEICISVRGRRKDWMNQKVWVTMREEGFNE